MVESSFELITLVEVARIADQKRSTVGNWKDRIEGFPSPRDMGPRGPLYDRAEMEKWLAETGRLPRLDPKEGNVSNLAHDLTGPLSAQASAVFILVINSLRSILSAKEWATLASAEGQVFEKHLRESMTKHMPFALSMLPSSPFPSEKMRDLLHSIGKETREGATGVAGVIIGTLAGDSKEELLPPTESLVVGLAGQGKVLFDPAAGTGQLLVAMSKALSASSATFIGQEQNELARDLAQLNFKIHGLEAIISGGDALTEDRLPDLRADVIVTNPPWGQRLFLAEKLAKDARWVWGAPGPGDGNMAWVQHCLYHLADQGRAVIVLPSKALFEQGRSAKIRQGIIKSGYLESVIALPPGLLRSTKIGTAVLVFAKGRRRIDGGPNSTLMVNLEEQPTEEWGNQRCLPMSLVSEVLSLHQRFLAGHEPTIQYAAIASYEAIAENGFDITPKRYVMSTQLAPSPTQFGDALKSARESLLRALESGHQADRQLEQLLTRQS
jgi:predicted DNA-binding transcriptional regulator AlpA